MNTKVVSHFSQPKMSCVVKNGFYTGNVHYRVVQSDNTLMFEAYDCNTRLTRSMERVRV